MELRAKIIGVLYKLRANRGGDLEGLAHDVFVEAWTHGTPITYQFIRHRAINAWQSRRIYHRVLDEKAIIPPKEPVDLTHVKEVLDLTMREAGLTSYELQVIYLVFYRGLTYSHAANELKKPEQWLKQTIHTALERLRKAGRTVEAKREQKESI